MKNMKTLKAIFATLIAVFTVSAVSASGGLNVNVSDSETNADVTVVDISTATMSTFEIEIMDIYGDNIYSMETEAPRNSLTKKYDFSAMENGEYWYSVKIDNEKILKKIKIEDGNAEVLNVRKTVEPHFKMDEKTLKISFLNPQLEKVKLYVYDENNNLLMESNLGTDFSIHQAVSFSDLKYGDYDVVIANDLDVYEYNVSLN